MNLLEFIEILKFLIGMIIALKEFVDFLVSLGPIIMDSFTHLWSQWLAALVGWLLMLWIIFWGQLSYLGYLTSRRSRLASSMFRFLFSVAFWCASLAHILQDYL